MIQVRIIQNGDPLPVHLKRYKEYASVPDDSRDVMLYGILRRAMLTVQEAADVAMLPCLLQLTVTDVHAGDAIRLYQGGKEIVAVNADGDATIEGYVQNGDVVRMPYGCKSVTITYRNEVILPEAEKLQPVVWELATAIYDGEDAAVQAAILKKCYGL